MRSSRHGIGGPWVVLAAVLATAAAALAESTTAPDAPPPAENAALDYIKAAELLPKDIRDPRRSTFRDLQVAVTAQGATTEQVLAAARAYCEARNLSGVHPFSESMALLHRGAGKRACQFPQDETGLLPMGLVMQLHRAAIVEARVCMAEGRNRQAVTVLCDAVQLALHEGDSGLLIESVIAVLIQNQGLPHLEGLLLASESGIARDAEALGYLRARLEGLRPKRLGAQVDLQRDEAWVKDNYMRRLPAGWAGLTRAERMARLDEFLWGGGEMNPFAPARKELEKDLDRVPEIFKRWVEEGEKGPHLPEGVFAKPYDQARGQLVEYDEKLAEFQKPYRKGLNVNPLIWTEFMAWSAVSYQKLAWSLARADADLARLRVLAAAEWVRARTGAYPTDLSALGPWFPDGLSKDPFTGKDFAYNLEDGPPVVRSTSRFAAEFANFDPATQPDR